jgi:hypothetical protein
MMHPDATPEGKEQLERYIQQSEERRAEQLLMLSLAFLNEAGPLASFDAALHSGLLVWSLGSVFYGPGVSFFLGGRRPRRVEPTPYGPPLQPTAFLKPHAHWAVDDPGSSRCRIWNH